MTTEASTTSDPKERQKDLLQAVGQMEKIKQTWERGERDEITEGFKDGVLDLAATFSTGDIPRACRELAIRVFEWVAQWHEYERAIDEQPLPPQKFWRTWADVLDQRNKVGVPVRRTLEPIKVLVDVQKVSMQQVAKMYGWFTPNGAGDIEKVQEEYLNPGTHTKDFVHPEERDWEKRTAAEIADRKGRIAAYLDTAINKPAPPAPESLGQLIRQKVGAAQIAKMKGLTVEEVLEAAQGLGIDLPLATNIPAPDTAWDDDSERAQAARNSVEARGVYSPGEGQGAPGAGDASQAASERINAEIVRLTETGKRPGEIARELGVSKARVSSAQRAAGIEGTAVPG